MCHQFQSRFAAENVNKGVHKIVTPMLKYCDMAEYASSHHSAPLSKKVNYSQTVLFVCLLWDNVKDSLEENKHHMWLN